MSNRGSLKIVSNEGDLLGVVRPKNGMFRFYRNHHDSRSPDPKNYLTAIAAVPKNLRKRIKKKEAKLVKD